MLLVVFVYKVGNYATFINLLELYFEYQITTKITVLENQILLPYIYGTASKSNFCCNRKSNKDAFLNLYFVAKVDEKFLFCQNYENYQLNKQKNSIIKSVFNNRRVQSTLVSHNKRISTIQSIQSERYWRVKTKVNTIHRYR